MCRFEVVDWDLFHESAWFSSSLRAAETVCGLMAQTHPLHPLHPLHTIFDESELERMVAEFDGHVSARMFRLSVRGWNENPVQLLYMCASLSGD